MDETVSVYDDRGRPVGEAPRSRVYDEGLWHASAGVMLRSRDAERIYVHRRTDTKAVFPGMHDCLAGGVVDPGETPEQTALRELEEELGVAGVEILPFSHTVWQGASGDRTLRVHLFGYEARWDGEIVHQSTEIADGWWWTRRELREHLADPEWPFVPDSRALLESADW
ncbi:NUDIX domain-containing protein [Rhodococcus rhodnii]|uniref:NUDIX superfamily hydrolase n=2 Tax=Rhodococcus rhodnii TaxID=38312 RepID=R7WSY4_9NOCA|nr:NUDIX domain-containing protein [Rhodococcus rhodnii]EOM78380.1 NUDIX superfamily hydrolase [Rhodococcus rhodnii LMG 5362]TXG91205.1 NUDIX domain-containing protein [Rhodococcus rhodnii]